MALRSLGSGTNSHVLLEIRELNSCCIASCHWAEVALANACFKVVGSVVAIMAWCSNDSAGSPACAADGALSLNGMNWEGGLLVRVLLLGRGRCSGSESESCCALLDRMRRIVVLGETGGDFTLHGSVSGSVTGSVVRLLPLDEAMLQMGVLGSAFLRGNVSSLKVASRLLMIRWSLDMKIQPF